MLKFLKWLGIIILLFFIVFIVFILYLINRPAVPGNYIRKQITGGPMEEKYAKTGSYMVSSKVYAAEMEEDKQRHYKVWYPNEEGQYPLVVMANGTGIPYQKYEEIFVHLASWGFVVIGNDYSISWNGESCAKSLDFVLATPELKAKVKEDKIAIGGHSQGGQGAFNAVLEQENGYRYKAIFALSPTNNELAMALGWGYHLQEDKAYAYDLASVKIPVFMVSSTGDMDEKTVIPLEKLQWNYNMLPDTIPAVIARRKDTDHADMLWRSDPYVTAWLMYWLYDDELAGNAFFGENPEMMNNMYWEDFQRK